ncbi:MAG: hypothetical protein LBP35_06695 [Candidatus Ancillula trichonymphae]|nr:hypothetical protein [Candidatus Ancillula trichonymphae]
MRELTSQFCDRNLPLDKVPVEVCSGGVFDFRKPRALGSLQIDDAFVGFEKVNGEHQVVLHRVDGRKTTIWGDSYYTAWHKICTIDSIGQNQNQGILWSPAHACANAFRTSDHLIIFEPKGAPGSKLECSGEPDLNDFMNAPSSSYTHNRTRATKLQRAQRYGKYC